jgi:hypothetical protein
MARIVEARDRFIQTEVFEEGYLGSEGAGFLACHPSNVSRALQKDDGVNRLRQVCHRTSPIGPVPRNRNTDLLRRFEIDDELEFDRLLEGNISWFDAVEMLFT